MAPVPVQLEVRVPVSAGSHPNSLRHHIKDMVGNAARKLSSCILATPGSDYSQPPTVIRDPANTFVSELVASGKEGEGLLDRAQLRVSGALASKTLEFATLQPVCQQHVQGVEVGPACKDGGMRHLDEGIQGDSAGVLRLTATVTAVAYVSPQVACSHVQSLLIEDACASLQARCASACFSLCLTTWLLSGTSFDF